MKLLSQYLDSELEEIHSNDIRFTTIGETDRLPDALQKKIDAAKERTKDNRTMVLNIALSYGGRDEILRAALSVAEDLKAGRFDPGSVTEELFSDRLYTAGLPTLDLLIRTGGEMRVSNFLLWQLAYAELYFTKTLWPDFDEDSFRDAIRAYQSRERRFGLTSEQLGERG